MLKVQRRWRVSTMVWLLAGVLVVCGTVGCGGEGDSASLTGNVTFDGKPIADGTLRLDPTGETPGQGAVATITDGSYEFAQGDGVFAGTHKVIMMASRPATAAEIAARVDPEEEEEEEDEDEDEGEEGAEPKGPSVPMTQYLPSKYGFASTLTVDLTGGENSKDFDLEP